LRFDETKPIGWSVIGEDGSTAIGAYSAGGLEVVEGIETILLFSGHSGRQWLAGPASLAVPLCATPSLDAVDDLPAKSRIWL